LITEDGHGGALSTRGNLDPAAQLPCQHLDDPDAQPTRGVFVALCRKANPIICDRQTPVSAGGHIVDQDAPRAATPERMLHGIDDEFRGDEAKPHGQPRSHVIAIRLHIERDGPAISDHRVAKTSAQARQVRTDDNACAQAHRLKVILHRNHRHHPLMRILEVVAQLLGAHRLRFEQQNVCDDLKAVVDAVLRFSQEEILLPQLVLQRTLGRTALCDVFKHQQ
jgi:hypothetical protein